MKHAKSTILQFISTLLILMALIMSTTTNASNQTGKASWYGSYHHGKKTASGERFNMHALTAAHRTLPLGTIVQVTNKTNGKTVKVKINDRGPYHGNRIIDLSRGAASQLDILKSGVGSVDIKVLSKPNAVRGVRDIKIDLNTSKAIDRELMALNNQPMINDLTKTPTLTKVELNPMEYLIDKINDSAYMPIAVSYLGSAINYTNGTKPLALSVTEMF